MFGYYMIHRPPMIGAQPSGFDSFEEYDPPRFIPELGRDAYAIIYYREELSEREIWKYELVPAEINVTLTPSEVELIKKAMALIPDLGDEDLTEAAHSIFDRLSLASWFLKD